MKNRVCLSLVPLLLSPVLQISVLAQNSKIDDIPSSAGTGSSPVAGLEKAPLSFEVNQGQSDPGVKFLSHGNGYSLYLTDSAAVLVLAKHRSRSKVPDGNSVTGDVIRMELPGAQRDLHVSGADELPGKANYFVGNNPSKWRAGIPTYARVRYEDVYPGIDLVYYGNQRTLEYDFIVAAKADPGLVRLRFQGAERLSITSSGDLAIRCRNGEIAFHKPVVYQMKGGIHEPVEGRFRRLAGNSIGFRLASYDHTRAVIIDPALAYSTYLGGSGPCLNPGLSSAGTCDSANAIAVDAAGDAYVVGGTINSDFPVTASAFQKVNNGMAFNNGYYINNAFVTKFNPRGSALIYSTYLGGTTQDESVGYFNGDVATGVAIDAAGNAYVTGFASSYNFPVTSNAFQKVNNAGFGGGSVPVSSNAFVTKLNATGSALIYSTYFGGSGSIDVNPGELVGDSAAGIAVDAAGNAYIAGTTASTDLPVTSNAYQKVNNTFGGGNTNLFITKFNPSGSALVYSTYLGGSGFFDNPGDPFGDSAGGIAIDSAGDAYVTGTSYSRDFPVTANAYQKVNKTPYSAMFAYGGSNAVVTEMNATGSALVYSTYLGGSTGDGANAIVLSPAGNVYVSGLAGSPDFPVTPHAFRKVNTNGDGFVTELNSAGSALVYSTFLGGGVANSIALDAFGSAYLTGGAGPNFPVTPDAFRKANHGNGDAFISKLDPTGSTMLYSSYLGGSGSDTGSGIAVDWFGDAYIAGTTCSTDFPLAGEPFQSTNKGPGCTAFVSKFIVNTVTGTRLVSSETPVTVGSTVTFTATVTPNMGSTVPTGSVVFSLDGTPEVTLSLNASGQASYSNSTLAAGRHTITATYLGNSTTAGSIASFGLTVIGASARIAVVSGDSQTTAVNTDFPEPLVVQVQDANGVPVPGALVTFASSSGVSWSANPVSTDANGRASVMVSYNTGGSKTVTASVEHVSISATFVEIVNWSDLITIVSGNNQTVVVGNAFQPLVVQVTNVNSVPLPGRTVEFAGVAFSENFVMTDANGMALDQPLLLGVGISFARAFTDHTPNPANFDLTVIPPPTP
ncbi:MAG: SBBP repeat-containing protein [Silvibacterium sp.]